MFWKFLPLSCLLIFLPTLSLGQEVGHDPGIYQFMPNGGQWPDHVNYRADITGGKIWLEDGGILYQLRDYSQAHEAHMGETKGEVIESIPQHLVFAEFVGANKVNEFEQLYPSREYYSYFIGSDKSRWASKLFTYNEIEYKNLYEGVDMRFFEKDQDLKYEFIVHPGGNPEEIKIHYHGQDAIGLNEKGDLVVKTTLGKIMEQKPYAYQLKNGRKVEVRCVFRLSEEGTLSFKLGKYDHAEKLVIDPLLVFATYSGSVSENFGMTATYAYDGSVYSGGTIYGNAYPTPGPAYDTSSNFTGPSSGNFGISDVFISKYSDDGSTMLWTTFIGGGNDLDGTETVHSLICDSLNNVYFFGATSSLDFPIQGGFQTTHAGGAANSNFMFNGVYFNTAGTDIYVAKLSENGINLMGSTYFGGSANDGINYRIGGGLYNSIGSYDSLTSNYGDQFRGEIFLDNNNNVLITSCTRSNDFPNFNGFQNSIAGQQDGVIAKVSNDLSTLIWSSFIGGTSNDACFSVKVNSANNPVIAGGTSSADFGVSGGSVYSSYQGGKSDGFVAEIMEDGSAMIAATYLGTVAKDQVFFLDIDDSDDIYVMGQSDGPMPILNAAYANANSGQFITKLTSDLATIDYQTVFGNGNGLPTISPSAFAIDGCQNVYVAGWGAAILQSTPLSGMPTTVNAFQQNPADGFDFYIIVLKADVQDILYGTYIGGANAHEHVDGGTSRFDSHGVLYQSICGGCGGFSDFPTTPGVWSNQNLSVNCNNVVLKFDFEPETAQFTLSQDEGCMPFDVQLTNLSLDTTNTQWLIPFEATIINGGANPEITFTNPGSYDVSLLVNNTFCTQPDTVTQTINVYPAPPILVTSNDTTLYQYSPVTLVTNSFGTGTNFTWSQNIFFSNPLTSGPTDSTIVVNPVATTTYYVLVSSGSNLCQTMDTVTVFFNPNISVGDEVENLIRIYPNPTDGKVLVESELTIATILIFDASGREVTRVTDIGQTQKIVDMTKLAKGTYLIKVVLEQGGIVEKKVIRN